MIPPAPVIRSLHHLMLSVCSAEPKSAGQLGVLALYRQRDEKALRGYVLDLDLLVMVLENLSSFRLLKKRTTGYALTRAGEKKLDELGIWSMERAA